MEAYLKSLELGRKTYFVRSRKFKPFFVTAGVLMVFYAFKLEMQAMRERAKVPQKKAQMTCEVHTLTAEELVSPPWVKNYKDWDHRIVEVSGRLIHRLAFLVPTVVNQYPGYQYIVPMVTSENEELEDRKGLLVDLGFLPREYIKEESRPMFNSFESTTIQGVVTKGEDYDQTLFWKKGNAFDEQRFITGNMDLKEFARVSELLNQKEAGAAIIERIDLSNGFDWNSPHFHNRDLSNICYVPYARTPSGFIHTESNVVERRWKQALFTGIGAAIALFS